jgi:hypothetical protein
MSDYVVHLTKGADPRSAFYSILLTGIINATAPSGIARDLANMNQNAAGFSEIPVQEVDRLANRYSAFGLGFHHNALVRQGGARVWYVELDRQVAAHLAALKDHHAQMNDPTDPFWAIAPFIERPGIYGNGTRYEFEWEREWRVARENMWFAAHEIAFIFAPEREHATLYAWLPTAPVASDRQLVTPPILDPCWPDDRLFTAFAQHFHAAR